MPKPFPLAKQKPAEVPGSIVVHHDRLTLHCGVRGHWVADVRRNAVLRVWDRRCKEYVLFRLQDLLAELGRLN